MKVWMRLGVELELSKAEISELTIGQCSPQRLLELVQSDHCKISGNSYFPEIEQNSAVAGLEWDIPETPAARFFVDTPDGVLVAYQTGDIDYPGIVVERKADKRGEPDIALSLTEYIPGGEVLNSYDSAQADEAHHQTGEVPEERQRFRADGRQEISAGFVTRSWPNEADDPERRFRTLHIGTGSNAVATRAAVKPSFGKIEKKGGPGAPGPQYRGGCRNDF